MGMWFNPIMASLLRSPFHGWLSHNTMLITVRGRKTGRPVTTPVNYFRDGDELLMVSFRSRTWWRNLRGHQAPVQLLLAGVRREATALVFESEADVNRGLAEIVARFPSMARPLGIGLDETGSPRLADLAQASQSRVIVRARLTPGPA
jgi:deazaflavin-dependent oxidoreductase (nitroreductase family)